MNKNRNIVVMLLVIISFFTTKLTFAAAGGCIFSDNCDSAVAFTFCSSINASNWKCDACGDCDPTIDTYTPASGQPNWGSNDQCDRAWASDSCSGTFTDPCGECTGAITCMAAISSCSGNYSICGSTENTSYSKVCVPSSYVGSCDFTFSVSGISCSGGGESLQWGVYPAASDTQCSLLATNYTNGLGMLFCDGAQTVDQSINLTLAPGNCYLVFFDGNAEASCYWNYNVTPPTPIAGFTPSATSVTIDSCVTLTSTASCYNTISWTTSDGQTSTATNPSFCWSLKGSYTVTQKVSSSLGSCTDAVSVSTAIDVCNGNPPSLSISSTNASCNAPCDGSTDLTVIGGSGSYTYNWSNGITTQDQTGNLCTGTYTVAVSDSNGCSPTASVTITSSTSLTAIISGTDVSCIGLCDGSAKLTVSGGSGSYNYKWSNGATLQSQISSLCIGAYTVTVTDSNNCKKIVAVNITQPSEITLVTNKIDEACGVSNGMASVAASGGTPVYSYKWSNGVTTPFITGLSKNTYTVTVTDANSCFKTAIVIINNIGVVAPSIGIVSSTNVSCFGGYDGSATATASGGTPPYSYSWSTDSVQTTETAAALSAGKYTIEVKDSIGCFDSTTVIIAQPDSLVTISSVAHVSCIGLCDGSIELSVSGGSGSYNYKWADGDTSQSKLNTLCSGTYEVTIKDANNCQTNISIDITEPSVLTVVTVKTDEFCAGSNGTAYVSASGGMPVYSYKWSNGDTTEFITGLSENTYTVTVTDANSCFKTAFVIINNVGANAPSIGIVTSTNVSCFGGYDGSATATASGSTPPYSYSWSTDPVQTTETATALSSDTYTVEVRDSIGCTASDTVTIPQPDYLTTIVSITDVSCNGVCDGSVKLSVTGGSGSYTYIWFNGDTLQIKDQLDSLCSGTDTVIVNDSNNCLAIASYTVSQPLKLVIDSIAFNNASCATCNDGNAMVYASGGTGSYIYSWQNGQSSQTADSLLPDNYMVCVTDSNTCQACDIVTISFGNFILSKNITESNVIISPNPFSTTAMLKILNPNFKNDKVELKIYDLLGREVKNSTLTPIAEGKYIIERWGLIKGIYFYKLLNENEEIGKGKMMISE